MSLNHLTPLPLGLAIQRGLINNFNAQGIFGYNSSVSSTFETISSVDGLYSYPTASSTAVATSSNTASDNTGTILVSGLNENYDQVSETLIIGGGAGSTSFIRIFSARMITANTGDSNVGNITVTVDSKTVAYIPATYGSSLSANYTIPRNYRGFIMSAYAGVSKQKELEAKIMTKQISNGNVWNTVGYQTTFAVPVYQEFVVPIEIVEKSDIEMRAKTDATTSVSGGFTLILEKVVQS
jgi:hypothetical protein